MLKINTLSLSFTRRRVSKCSSKSRGELLKIGIGLITLLLISFKINSQELPKGAIQILPENIKWIDAPPPLPSGSKIAVLEGSPKLEGMFTMRAMFPPYFKIPAHWHPKDELVTVIEGVVYVGFGDKTDTTGANKFTVGSFYVNPAESRHYVFTQSEGCVLQISGMGPWGLNYIEETKRR